jgi:trehalose/maltose hydrolase-like predicted phosphorylase
VRRVVKSEQDIVPPVVLEAVQPFPEPVDDPAWVIKVEGWDRGREPDYESWLTVANGRTGTRGSLEQFSAHSAPAIYVAGIYAFAEEGPLGPEIPEMIHGPEWVRLDFQLGNERAGLHWGDVLELRRTLDLRRGILFRTWRHQVPSGATLTFRSARFASLADRAILVLMAELESEDSTRVWTHIPLGYTTLFDRVEMQRRNGRVEITLQGRRGGSASFAVLTEAREGRVDRIVAVDRGGDQKDLIQVVNSARGRGTVALMEEHCRAWAKRWRDSDIVLGGDIATQRAMRFALYHLISSGDPESDLASIGARGLTGPGYRGHVFWDTEVFVLPFFIYTDPPTARALLAYRYRRLPAARKKAAEYGYRGALYPWESADTGEDVTPPYVTLKDGTRVPVLTALQQHHISADVAWATYQYWRATRDDEFLKEMGAEILVETARFWASRATRDPDGRYHIYGIMGPDEYHDNISDNAFTNVLARWNLERAVEVLEVLHDLDAEASRQLAERLKLRKSELRQWRAVAQGLFDGFDPDTLLYEQFAGFFDLENLRAVDVAPRPFSGELEVGMRRLPVCQVIKQSDVLMLAHMLPEVVSSEVARANYRYYEPRTSHGSSLSPAIHASVAARTNNLEDALDYFRMAGNLDLGGRVGNSAQGVHLATMGGLWQAAVMGFGGLRATNEGLHLDPRLPSAWERLIFPIQWRGARLEVEADPESLSLSMDARARVALGEQPLRWLGSGHYRARREGDGWGPLQKADTK